MITKFNGLAYLGGGMCLRTEEGGSSREVYGEVASIRSSIDEGGRNCVRQKGEKQNRKLLET